MFIGRNRIMATEKRELSKWDRIMMAITFAEAGEYKTAQDVLEQTDRKQKRPETRVEQRPSMEL
jgi:hypothetical protein